MDEIVSPCISVCTIDRETGYCLGCWRTRDEIARWSRLGRDERLAVLRNLHDRREAAGQGGRRGRRGRRRAAG